MTNLSTTFELNSLNKNGKGIHILNALLFQITERKETETLSLAKINDYPDGSIYDDWDKNTCVYNDWHDWDREYD